jgi:3-hydroxyisobutyrate dehydrogenase-like beta-hydroxyacid dehydrogenase
VAIVGLGLVGHALTARLRAAGYALHGHDRAPETQRAWGSRWHAETGDPAKLGASCPVVVLAVYDSAGVLELLEGRAGVLTCGKPSVIVDCSTGDPEVLRALAARLRSRGIDFIEAPLSGSSRQIADGQATMLLGARAEVLERHDALLDALSPQRIHVGDAGMGAAAKLATNLVLGLNRAALAEGLVFAERLGIAPADFLQLVRSSPARSAAADEKGQRMVDADFAEPQSRVRQHLKDLDLMLAAAAGVGQPLPLAEAHAALLRDAVQAGDGDLDNAAVVGQIRRLARDPALSMPVSARGPVATGQTPADAAPRSVDTGR